MTVNDLSSVELRRRLVQRGVDPEVAEELVLRRDDPRAMRMIEQVVAR